jgi:dienelactone hydrolase
MKTILHVGTLLVTVGILNAGSYPISAGSLKSIISAQSDSSVVSPQRIAEAQILADKFLQKDYTAFMEKFDATMKGALPLEKLQQARESLDQRLGAFQKQLGIRAEKYQQFDIIYITWQFEAMTIDFKLIFNSSGQIAGMFFVPVQSTAANVSPAYVRPDSYQEREITIGDNEWALPGTLTIPAGNGPFPAVVLIHGSGPNDRDETIGPNKPFRDLAWGLASKGIAVVRYEKRTKQHAARYTPEIIAKLTVKEETIDDALAAVVLLRQTHEIDPARIFILGHSLGGMLLPRIAVADPKIAGLIIMAGPTRPLEELALDQFRYISNLDSTISSQEKIFLDTLSAQIARLKDPQLSLNTPASALPLGLPASYWLDLRDYKPAVTAKKLKQPILILQGGRDYQVTLVDLDGWKSILSSHSNVQFKLYPDLNHLFITGKGKSTPAEYGTTGHVAEQVIMDISGWIFKL